jgi:hypothetical protein
MGPIRYGVTYPLSFTNALAYWTKSGMKDSQLITHHLMGVGKSPTIRQLHNNMYKNYNNTGLRYTNYY